ncbi:hypothetical protein KKG72_06845 [bacterium]|nr:hypothetical protein [bacterium]MBU1993967.1 hypothetical protein [bacterium]
MDDKKKREIEEAYQKRWGNNNFEKKQTLEDLTKVYQKLQSDISSAIGIDKQSENLRIQEFMTSQKLAELQNSLNEKKIIKDKNITK